MRTQIFILHRDVYQPGAEDYVYTNTYYGSCSGCDTLQGILYDNDDFETKVNGLFTLALHIVQRLRKMDNDS